MKFISIILLIAFSIAILTAFILRSRKRGKRTLYVGGKAAIKKKKAKPPISKAKIMGPENPLWVKMYAEEMAKRNTAQTTAVIKKWLKEK
jgi:flagellar biosynthesis/type III secretory pathway M-ring protein FliF/YscJ